MMLAGLILTIVLVILGLITIGLLLRAEKQANKARTPVLKYSNFMRFPGPGFRFNLQNYGPTAAKEIEIEYSIFNFGVSKIPARPFRIRCKEEILAPRELCPVFFDYTSEEPVSENDEAVITVEVSYETDFFKPEPLILNFGINNAEIIDLQEPTPTLN